MNLFVISMPLDDTCDYFSVFCHKAIVDICCIYAIFQGIFAEFLTYEFTDNSIFVFSIKDIFPFSPFFILLFSNSQGFQKLRHFCHILMPLV